MQIFSQVIQQLKLTVVALVVAGSAMAVTEALAAEPIQLETYKPTAAETIFPVTSNLIWAENEVLLIDAQFAARDTQALMKKIKDSGKSLNTIYISHGDPDFYFGLAVITDAFPEAKVVATPAVVQHIQQTQAAKLAHWGPELGTQAPVRIVTPEPLTEDHLQFAGHRIEIIGLTSATPERTSLWLPELKTVLGGVLVDAGEHVWLADTQTLESRKTWVQLLDQLLALQPEQVIPGHYSGTLPQGDAALRFTKEYLTTFEQELTQASNADQLIQAMQQHYPQLPGKEALALSAKVLKGEMEWE